MCLSDLKKRRIHHAKSTFNFVPLNEETLFAKGHTFILNLMVNNAAFKGNDLVKTAFEDTLKDLCSGMLPLGGGVNRGNGCFEGTIKRNGELIYENN